MPTQSHVGNGYHVGNWFIINCSCGWSSPLCDKADKCKAWFHEHREKAIAANQNGNTMRT